MFVSKDAVRKKDSTHLLLQFQYQSPTFVSHPRHPGVRSELTNKKVPIPANRASPSGYQMSLLMMILSTVTQVACWKKCDRHDNPVKSVGIYILGLWNGYDLL